MGGRTRSPGGPASDSRPRSRGEGASLSPLLPSAASTDPQRQSLSDPKSLVGFPRALSARGSSAPGPWPGTHRPSAGPASDTPPPLGPGPPPPTRSETGVKGSPRHVVAEQHRIGRESRGRIGVEARNPARLAAPGPRPGAWPGPRSVRAPRRRIEPRARPRLGEVGAGRGREGGGRAGGRPRGPVRAPHGRGRGRGRSAASKGLSRPAARLAHARDRRPRGHPRRFPFPPALRRPGRGR